MSRVSGRIAQLNDAFRTTLCGGKVMITNGVNALGPDTVARILAKVTAFTDFNENNDPHGEHDFGAISDGVHSIFWKIDYYDPALTYGSDDPSSAECTVRVMTVMLSDEY